MNRSSNRPWVLVCGGFHREGGMDRANRELAAYLASIGAELDLVSYRVDPDLAASPGVRIHLARRLAGSFFLARGRLDRLGRAVAADATARSPSARVVVNGVNCDWPDINWVHYVHHEWRATSPHAPLWFKLKHRADAWLNRQRELKVLRRARILLANSDRTRRDLIRDVGIAPDRVCTVHLGCDDQWKAMTPERRTAARAWLGFPAGRPLIVFVGAFGHDSRKGFDTLWEAWKLLCARSEWDADLAVAGGGRGLDQWRAAIARSGLAGRVRMLGFTRRIGDLLAAADLLVSPVRYESYGLNVQEALSCGVPAIVSRDAGVAERYTSSLGDLLLPDPCDAHDLAGRIMRWRGDIEGTRERVAPLAASLRAYSWRDMARRIVETVTETCARPQDRAHPGTGFDERGTQASGGGARGVA